LIAMATYPPLLTDGTYIRHTSGAIMEVQMALNNIFGCDLGLEDMRAILAVEQLVRDGHYHVQPFNCFEATSFAELRCAILHRLHAAYEHYARGRMDFDNFSHFVQVLTAILHAGQERDWEQDEPMTVSFRPFYG